MSDWRVRECRGSDRCSSVTSFHDHSFTSDQIDQNGADVVSFIIILVSIGCGTLILIIGAVLLISRFMRRRRDTERLSDVTTEN